MFPRIAVVTLVLALALTAVASRVAPDLAPQSDDALIDLHVRNVVTDGQPVGAYSRFGWSHPGPLYFQWLAPFYLAGGSRHLGVVIGTAALNVFAVCLLLWVTARASASLALPGALTICLGLFLFRVDGLIASPWNPHAGILMLGALIASAAAASIGQWRWLPVTAALASFVVQAHVGFALAAIAIAAMAGVLVALRAISGAEARRGLARALAWSIAVIALVWALPLIDELRPGGDHNLRHVMAFFTTSRPYSPAAAERAFASMWTAPFAPGLAISIDGPPTASRIVVRLAIAEAALLAAVAIFWRVRRAGFEHALALVTAAASVAAWMSLRRLPELPRDYTVLWVSMLGALSWSLILAAPLSLLANRARADARRGVTPGRLLIASAIAVTLAAAVQVRTHYLADSALRPRVDELARLAARGLGRPDASRVHVDVTQDLWGVQAGVILQLDRLGYDLDVPADWLSMFGRRFVPGTATRAVVLAPRERRDAEMEYRADVRFAGAEGNLFVYASQPMPPMASLDGALRLESAVGTQGSADVLLAAGGTASPVTFFGPTSSVTFIADTTIRGLRIMGEGGTAWQLTCAADPSLPALGRVQLDIDGRVDAYPRDLPACSRIRIAPVSETQAQWLGSVRALGIRP